MKDKLAEAAKKFSELAFRGKLIRLRPSIEKQIKVIQETIDMLRDSYMERLGPLKGHVTEPCVVEEISCLKATLRILRMCHRAIQLGPTSI